MPDGQTKQKESSKMEHESQVKPKVMIELPVEWIASDIDREARQSSLIFTQLVTAATELGCEVATTPAVMYSDTSPRLLSDENLCISYHSHGDEANVWRVKESYIPGYFTFDRFGYSGFSELARFPDRFFSQIDSFDETQAEEFVSTCKKNYIDGRISKYEQNDEKKSSFPEKFVFLPLQTEHDAVQSLSDITQATAIKGFAEAAQIAGVNLVIKRHPYCGNQEIKDAVLDVVERYSNVFESEASIHDLFQHAEAVLGANSGVLFEALLAGLPVYTYADSDFASVTNRLSSPIDFQIPFQRNDRPISPEETNKFLAWYLTKYCISLENPAHTKQKLEKILKESTLPLQEASYELQRYKAKQIVAELELQRRSGPKLVATHFEKECEKTLNKWRYRRPISYLAKISGRKPLTVGKVWRYLPSSKRPTLDASYYEDVHSNESSYQKNNWLVEYLGVISRQNPKSVLEVGCGNGKFLNEAAERFPTVIGADWVKTKSLPLHLPNVEFRETNLLKDALPEAELVCSADVLEHIPPKEIESVIDKLFDASSQQFHVIACYDDGHSHLSVFDPGTWLALFRRKGHDARFIDIKAPDNDPSRLICVIATFSDSSSTG